MPAKIKGAMVTPTQSPVPVTIHATPIPTPGKATNGAVIIPGEIASAQTSPIDVDILPGTYRLTVYSPTQMLTARIITMKDGDTLDLATLIEGTPDPTQPGTTPTLTGPDGQPITCADIHVVHSRTEAEALPDGAVYVLVAKPTPAIAAHAAAQATGNTITIRMDGQEGDRTVIAINTKAVADQAFTWPTGWTVLTEPYWVGTQQSTVAYGPWAQTINIQASKPLEAAWVGVTVRGGGTPTAGPVKDRTKDPKETNTITAPAVPDATGLALAFALERSMAAETRDQITLSTGWETVDFATQEGSNYQTALAARWVGTGTPTALTVTYPNAQATNGAGIQVVIPND